MSLKIVGVRTAVRILWNCTAPRLSPKPMMVSRLSGDTVLTGSIQISVWLLRFLRKSEFHYAYTLQEMRVISCGCVADSAMCSRLVLNSENIRVDDRRPPREIMTIIQKPVRFAQC